MRVAGARVNGRVLSRTMESDERYLTQGEVCDVLGLKVRMVQKLGERGQLTKLVSDSGQLRYLEAEVLDLKRKRETFRPV